MQMPIASSGSPGSPYFCLTWLQIRVPKTPSSGSVIWYNCSQNSGKYCIYYHLITKGTIKDTDEQGRARWRGTKSKVWKHPKHRSFCYHGVGVHYPPGIWMHSPTWSSWNPFIWDFFWRLHYHGWLNPWPPPSLSPPWRSKVGSSFIRPPILLFSMVEIG